MQKIFLAVITLLLTVSLSNAQNASLSGKVTQKNNQEPLPGAHIYFSGTTLGTATSNTGDYQIKNLKPGNYDIVFSFSGFKRVRKNIDLVSGENTLDIQMAESDNNLGEIVVTGTGTAHHLKTAPVPTELISKKVIESTAASEFTDLMLNVSPSFDFAPSTMGSGMKINGLGNDFILVLVDGKRLYGDIGGMNDLNRINPDNIERVEVLKGAASLLYGSDAIAGVVNIITKKSHRKVHASLNARLRDHATYQTSANVDFNIGKMTSNTSLSYKGTDGWQLSPYEVDDDELVETKAKTQNAYDDYTFSQRLGFTPLKHIELYVEGSKYEKDLQVPKNYQKYGYFYDDVTGGAGAKYLLNKQDFISVNYHYDRFKYYYKYNQEYKDYNKGDKSINNDQQLSNLQIKYVNTLSENNKLTVGAEYLSEKMISEQRLMNGEATANTLALYAQDELTILENLDIVAGLRYVKHEEFGNAFTPKISLLYKYNHFNLRGTYGLGYKAPSLKELYYDYEKRGTIYMGNTDLDPQKSRYYSAGLEFNNQVFSVSISPYINYVEDLITYQDVPLQDGDTENKIKKRRQHFNVEEARTKGVDVLVSAKLGHGFTAGGGYSYVDGRDITNDVRLDGVAYHYGNVRLAYDRTWKKYDLNATILGRLQDEKFYDEEEGNAKGYNIWKLTTNHRFTHLGAFILEASAGIDNVFDYVDDVPYGYNYGTISPGRTFFVGLKIHFAQ